MSECNSIEKTYYQKNKEIIRSKQSQKKYENDKERLRKTGQEINTEIYLKKKKKKREQERNRFHNMSAEKKQKLKEYQRNYQKLI